MPSRPHRKPNVDRHGRMAYLLTIGLILFFFPGTVGWPQSCCACDTPVYEYARQNWMLDAYDVVVFQQKTLAPEARKALEKLEAYQKEANIVVHHVRMGPDTDPVCAPLS